MWPFDIDQEYFFANYWQKKPLLLKQAIDISKHHISGDELAGLALEDDIESRLIEFIEASEQWQLRHGPFTENDFLQLGDKHWTILVQNVDAWSEPIRALLDYFSPIPNWRLDDVMVSFAAPCGGVGPHVDQYDVFLIQGNGERQWQVGEPNQPLSFSNPHPLLKQVNSFDPIIDEKVMPGDVLYIPPNTPHNGIALTECITYSVGFRAPSQHALLEQLLLNLLENSEFESERYHDAIGTVFNKQSMPSNIANWMKDVFFNLSATDLENAFAQLVTRPKYEDLNHNTPENYQTDSPSVTQKGNNSKQIVYELAPFTRLIYQLEDNGLLLWVNGEKFIFAKEYAQWVIQLSESRRLCLETQEHQEQIVDFNNNLAYLVDEGWVLIKS